MLATTPERRSAFNKRFVSPLDRVSGDRSDEGAAAALAELRVAFTGINARPVRLESTAALCCGALDAAKQLDNLGRDRSCR